MDRNAKSTEDTENYVTVALRKESVDRNWLWQRTLSRSLVALRKESVDRNRDRAAHGILDFESLSARRAWIEIVR